MGTCLEENEPLSVSTRQESNVVVLVVVLSTIVETLVAEGMRGTGGQVKSELDVSWAGRL